MGEAVLSYLVEFLEGLPDAQASNVDDPLPFARTLREAVPERGIRDFDAVLATVKEAASHGFETAGPGYLAYIPGGGLFSSALADFVATCVNRFVNLWSPAPAFVQIEATVIEWISGLFGLPETAGGILTSGGSMANLSALVTARRAKLPEDFLRGTIYASDQTHASVAKAAMICGFPVANVRAVATDARLRIEPQALAESIERDRADGFTPFCLVANAGTTNTGAVDPIDELASVAQREELWLHVDAAYGGFFQLTERGRAAFRGIERADSITLDPHKAMFLPYGTGCLLVRDRALLRQAHQVQASYLQDLAAEEELPNFSDYSPELSRDFRGLRIWLPLKLHGLGAFRSALDEKLDLTQVLYDGLAEIPGIRLLGEPDLTVVAFRYDAGAGDDDLSRRLLDRINASKRVFLSSTMIEGRFTIRACIVSHRTHRDRIDECVEIVRRCAKELTEAR
jgi:aromatic-L-amino-acid decarboxylase